MPETLDKQPFTSATAHEEACWLPRHRKSAGVARRLLRDFLAGHSSGEQYAEVGELLLSELVTNAIAHAHVPPDRLILVRFALNDGTLRIEVHDADNDRRPVTEPAAAPDWDRESGRGLFLISELSERWGCDPRPCGIGKIVWCVIAPTAPPRP
jgi:anti-sigma regulatory factor (Ser/Thr protein kinase)